MHNSASMPMTTGPFFKKKLLNVWTLHQKWLVIACITVKHQAEAFAFFFSLGWVGEWTFIRDSTVLCKIWKFLLEQCWSILLVFCLFFYIWGGYVSSLSPEIPLYYIYYPEMVRDFRMVPYIQSSSPQLLFWEIWTQNVNMHVNPTNIWQIHVQYLYLLPARSIKSETN